MASSPILLKAQFMLMAHSSCLLAVCTSGVIEGHTSERKRNFSKQKKNTAVVHDSLSHFSRPPQAEFKNRM